MKITELRLDKLNQSNSYNRTLFESVVVPEIIDALKDWEKNVNNGVLIGGLALSYHIKPRYTQDVDILFLNETELPNNVPGFKKIRKHSFQHNKTHVEIEVLSPQFLNIPPNMVDYLIKDSLSFGNIRVASANGLAALKLKRFNRQDQADIEQLKINANADITDYKQFLSQTDINNFNSIR